MNQFKTLAIGMVLLGCSLPVLGQHGGHGGGRGDAPRSTGRGGNSDSSLQDFQHALAVQATPDQATAFHSLAKSTEDARKQAQDLLQLADKPNSPSDLSRQTATLTDAVEDAQNDNDAFVKSFSKSQKSGLKDLTKKLGKANAEVAKHRKVMAQQLRSNKVDGGRLAGTADKLEKALAEFQAQQISLGKEMGIQM